MRKYIRVKSNKIRRVIKPSVCPVKSEVEDNTTQMDSFEENYQRFIAELKAKKGKNETIIQEEVTSDLQSDGQN